VPKKINSPEAAWWREVKTSWRSQVYAISRWSSFDFFSNDWHRLVRSAPRSFKDSCADFLYFLLKEIKWHRIIFEKRPWAGAGSKLMDFLCWFSLWEGKSIIFDVRQGKVTGKVWSPSHGFFFLGDHSFLNLSAFGSPLPDLFYFSLSRRKK